VTRTRAGTALRMNNNPNPNFNNNPNNFNNNNFNGNGGGGMEEEEERKAIVTEGQWSAYMDNNYDRVYYFNCETVSSIVYIIFLFILVLFDG
jgi:hypothetical protein